ncbi:MAG: ABC1 kinase family protein [Acidimicrobiia bacterium]
MKKSQRVMEVATTLGALMGEEVRLRWQRSRNGVEDPEVFEKMRAIGLRRTLEELGPLYIKVGQLLSTRPDIVSQTVIDALQDLHEEVNVRPFPEFEPVMVANLGMSWRNRFKDFDTEHPIGAASIAQVYSGTLKNGKKVAVKIQRPGVAASTKLDMEILEQAVKLAMKRMPDVAEIFQPEAMLEVIFGAMRPEIDFTAEAKNIEDFEELLDRYDNIEVPEVYKATREVLIMSLAPGVSIREAIIKDFTKDERETIGRQICEMLFRGLLVDGIFHGDPHPGNIFVCPGEPATVIDFGIIGKVDRRTALGYTRFMIAMAVNDGEVAGRAALELGSVTPRADVSGFLGDMQRYIPTVANVKLQDMEFGTNFNQFLVFCSRRGIAVNPGIALFGKASANMEGSLRIFAPELNTFEVFEDVMGGILRDQAGKLTSQQELLRVANEAFQAYISVPEQVRYLAQSVMNGQYVLRTRDDSAWLQEAREDVRAKKMRRLMLGLGAAALWLDHRRKTSP